MNITRDHRAVRNQASIDMASAGAGAPSLKLYTAEGGTFLGQRTLASPCGSITAEGRISLLPAPGNDLVVVCRAGGPQSRNARETQQVLGTRVVNFRARSG